MPKSQRFSPSRNVFTAVALFLTVASSACQCRNEALGSKFGEIQVIWRDETGALIQNRDAIYDFGTALSGESKTLTLTVRNSGTGPLTLAALAVAEGDPVTIGATAADMAAFEVKFNRTTVNPTEQVEFAMVFAPQQLKSSFLSKLTLTGEGTRAEDSQATVTLKGLGEKGACELPDSIDFGSVLVGETFKYALEMRNPTAVPTTGFAGDITGPDTATFVYGAGSPRGDVAVAPKTTVPVIIAFSPTEKRSYSASVVARGPGQCPQKTIAITGRGGDETLSWAPTDRLDFGFVNPGADGIREIVFKNPAGLPVTITNIATTMPSDFFQKVDVGQDPTKFVVPGGNVPTPMKVACNPTALLRREGLLNFQTGLSRTPTGRLNLLCTGGGPKIRVTPRPTLSFGRVGFFPGTSFSVNRRVSIQNVGSKPTSGDVSANLFLGQLINGMPGQGQPFDLIRGANTDADELTPGFAGTYNLATGIEATAGRNFIDVLVTLKPKSLGMKSGTLTIWSNDISDSTVTVDITADIQELPPCRYAVSPMMANFGLVTPGISKDLPVTITNLGTSANEICYFSGIDVAAGTDPAYSIVGGGIPEKELGPGQSFDVVVRLAPTGAVPNVLTSLNGVLRINASSPTTPQTNVLLNASIGPSCLAVTPDPQDFGTVKIGCNSASRQFNVYNVCQQAMQLKSVVLQTGAGQPAGGPNCTGGAACPEFFLAATPQPNISIPPGGSPVTFSARYRPIDVSADTGAIALTVVQSGQTVTYLVGLKGNGDTVGQQTDTFVQDLKPKADILIVVDDSGSMEDKQNSLSQNFGSFITYAQSAQVDYQIGTTSTTIDNSRQCIDTPLGPVCGGGGSKAWAGALFRDAANGVAPILKPTSQNIPSTFAKMVRLGTQGSASEQGLEAATLALTPPKITGENVGFLRDEANLAVVVISDAGDGSPQPLAYYQNRLINIKGFNRLSMFTFNVIGRFAPRPASGCTYDEDPGQERYAALAMATSGVKDEICTTNWALALQGLGTTAFGYRLQFFLNSTPDRTPGKLLEVRLDGVDSPQANWSYDAMTNSIKFVPTAAPRPGQTLSIRYDTQCFP